MPKLSILIRDMKDKGVLTIPLAIILKQTRLEFELITIALSSTLTYVSETASSLVDPLILYLE